MHQSADEGGAGGLLRHVSSLHMRVFVLRKFHAARLFNDLIWWVMVKGYKCGLGLAEEDVSVRSFFFFFFSVVDKMGGPDPLDPPSGSAPVPRSLSCNICTDLPSLPEFPGVSRNGA